MNKKISSLTFALMLIISTFAFAFLIGSETKMVSAADTISYSNSQTVYVNGIEYTAALNTKTGKYDYFYSSEGEVTWGEVQMTKDTLIDEGMPQGKIVSEGDASPKTTPAPVSMATGSLKIGGNIPTNAQSTYQSSKEIIFKDASGTDVTIPANTPYTLNANSGTDKTTYSLTTKDGHTYTGLEQKDFNSLKSGNGIQLSAVANGAPSDIVSYTGTEYVSAGGKFISPSTGGVYNADGVRIGTDRGDVKTSFGEMGFGTGQLVQGLTWAATAAGLIQVLGTVFGADSKTVNALSAAAAVGLLVGKGTYALLGRGGETDLRLGNYLSTNADGSLNMIGRNSGIASAVVGVAAAWLTYNAMWSSKKTSTETVNFNCLPWQAPHGGTDCELCNDNTLPCSEYRCKSLGQSCAIVNKGTSAERCVDVNPRDSSPPVIKPLAPALTQGFMYFDVKDMPPGAGFKIKSKSTSTGCIPPFTPITFGITTDEPSQCKIDLVTKGNYKDMSTYLGGSNIYSYNHTEYLSLPSAKDFQNSSIKLVNGKELSFYMRCRDAVGNTNEADYQMTLCVDPSPDTTAPVVQGTSIDNGGCVPSNTDNASLNFYVNEPSECKWDFKDMDYNNMKYDMVCQNNPTEMNALQVYVCNAFLTGVSRDNTNYFVRCKDQPQAMNDSKRNTNRASYPFSLKGSNPLKLTLIQPNDTIYGSVRPAPVELLAQTTGGCDNNQAVCFYSTTNTDKSFVKFYDTSNADGISTQRLDLDTGKYTYFVKCVDAGGNMASSSTKFGVEIDTNAPLIARIYQEDTYLKIVTPKISECVYTNDNCDYNFNEGTTMTPTNSTTHIADWSSDKTYYIKCRDEYKTEPFDCSAIVRPTQNFL